ncbi:hypothetical protein [Clostridium uliginosum]|uniref:Uncharacterized protein n=1 Tax=Clostridium uliginosum TaxID=119641 RepID=A0A1I1P8P7_9CLOT|nr:hypothetical protein [Clostridium uliginosum]SFD02380.1 hypothetical protein SAMN05421842_11744 [Clostridium uliginosum]
MYIVMFLLVIGISIIAMFPLKAFSQKIYNETGYNALKGLSKFLMILLGFLNIIFGVVVSVTIESKYYGLLALSVGILLVLYLGLIFVNKKAGIKYSILLSLLQGVSGTVFIILVFVKKSLLGGLVSGLFDILSVDESKYQPSNQNNTSL